MLWVVTPEGLGSFRFRSKRISRAGLQACNTSTRETEVGGSEIQGRARLRSQFEASLSSYHGDFTDDGKCEVENPNLTRSSVHDPTTAEHLFLVQGESWEVGLRQGVNTNVSAMQRVAAPPPPPPLPVALTILLLSKDPQSAEVGRMVKGGQAWARGAPRR